MNRVDARQAIHTFRSAVEVEIQRWLGEKCDTKPLSLAEARASGAVEALRILQQALIHLEGRSIIESELEGT